MTEIVLNTNVFINGETELRYILSMTASRSTFNPETCRNFDYASMIRELLPKLDHAPRVIVIRGETGEFESVSMLVSRGTLFSLTTDVDSNAVKLLVYTFGTVIKPKAVLNSFHSIHADRMQMKAAMSLTKSDCVFCPSPLNHTSGFLWLLNVH